VLKSHSCIFKLHSACINHTGACQNYTRECGNQTLRVEIARCFLGERGVITPTTPLLHGSAPANAQPAYIFNEKYVPFELLTTITQKYCQKFKIAAFNVYTFIDCNFFSIFNIKFASFCLQNLLQSPINCFANKSKRLSFRRNIKKKCCATLNLTLFFYVHQYYISIENVLLTFIFQMNIKMNLFI
jgi:hypothetical protein